MTDPPELPGLDEFGRNFKRAAAERIEAERPRSARRWSVQRVVIGALAAVLLPAGGLAIAGALQEQRGPALPERTFPSSSGPAPDGSVLSGSAVPDPAGGSPWAVKVFSNARGDECVAIGRLRDGTLGRVTGRTFRPFPARISGTCGRLSARRLVFGVQTRGGSAPRTVVFGLSPGRAPVELRQGTERFKATPRALGSFIIIIKGVRSLRGATLRTRVEGRDLAFELE